MFIVFSKCASSQHVKKSRYLNVYETDLKHIQRDIHECNIINKGHFEAIFSQAVYLCGLHVHNFANSVFLKRQLYFIMLRNDLHFDLLLVVFHTQH